MARKKELIEAVAYLRTSSAANVGADKDSDKRQRAAIEGFAKRAGYDLVDTFPDPAVSGADAIESRPGFAALLDRIEGNGVRTVIVEDASRFARDIQTHVLGIALLRARGVRLLASNGDDLTDNTDEMTEGMLTIAAVFSQIEKKRLVRKLAAARQRIRDSKGKCEGRKSWAEINPAMVLLAKSLRPRSTKGQHKRSLRDVAAELAKRGHLNERGNPFSPSVVQSMLA